MLISCDFLPTYRSNGVSQNEREVRCDHRFAVIALDEEIYDIISIRVQRVLGRDYNIVPTTAAVRVCIRNGWIELCAKSECTDANNEN